MSSPEGHRRTSATAVRLAGIVIAAGLLLAGCGGSSPSGAPEVDPGPPVTSAPSTEGPDDTGTDDTGTEDGGGDEGGDEGAPSLSLPQLPIGGDSQVVTGSDLQCVNVNWIVTEGDAGRLAPGYAITVDSIDVPEPFALAESGCGDDPPSCTGYTFTAGSASPACIVAVMLDRPFSGFADDSSPGLTIEGTVVCGTADEPVPAAACEAFKAGAESSQQRSIGLSTDFTPDPSPSGG